MQKIILTSGEIVEVENNQAHALIESGAGELYREEKEVKGARFNKMMSKKRKKLITK